MMQKPLSSNVIDQTKKSSDRFNCFSIQGLAKCLSFVGFVSIPLKSLNGKLVPAIPWKEFRTNGNPDALEEVRGLFSQKEVVGVALRTGEVSDLLVLDVDEPEKFNEFYPLEKLKEEASYIIETKDRGHFHFGFLYDPDFPESKSFLSDAGFELKSNGSLVNFYTVLPECQYKPIKLEPLRPMPQELKEKILGLMARQGDLIQKGSPELQKPKDLDPGKIIEIASEVYQRGQRQYWVIYTAGLLRKLGFSFEETREALKEFLRSQRDEELEMRLAGVEHTFKEHLDNVKGLSGLLELGLSEEAILKINSLKRKNEANQPRIKLIPSIETPKILEELSKEGDMALIRGLVYRGINLLAGAPKVGKTFLLIQIGVELALMGYKVVYLAFDEDKRTFVLKLKTLGLEKGHPNFAYYTRDDALKARLPLKLDIGGLEILEEVMLFYKPDVLIIDIWGNIRPETKKNKDFYTQDYEAVSMLRKLTPYLKAIIISHHLKKSKEDDPINKALGTSGLTGAVDTVVILERKRTEDKGKLLCVSRYDQEIELGLEFKNGKWTILGDAKEIEIAEEQKKIIEAIQELGGKATPKTVAEWLGKNYHTVKNQMLRMWSKGILKKDTRGNYLFEDTKENSHTFLLDIQKSSLSSLSSLCSLSSLSSLSPFETIETIGSSLRSSLSEPLKNLGSEAKDYSDYSDYSVYSKNIEPSFGTPTPTPTPTQTQTLERTSSDTPTQRQEEEEVVYLLMPEGDRCPICNCEVWKVSKRIFEIGKGGGSCVRCGHLSWFGNFGKGQVLESEAEVDFWVWDLSGTREYREGVGGARDKV